MNFNVTPVGRLAFLWGQVQLGGSYPRSWWEGFDAQEFSGVQLYSGFYLY